MLFLRPINVPSMLTAVGVMAVVAIIFAVIIVIVSKYMAVPPGDEREDEVAKLLAGANCGGCGKAGCSDFAKALCAGTANITDCNPTSNESKEKIAAILALDFKSAGDVVAVVHCDGGNKCEDKFDYHGYGNCVNQELLSGGRKQCEYGCMGSGSCVSVCPVNAISLVDGKAVIDRKTCIACGACVRACPKHLISLIPEDAKVYVACTTCNRGKEVMSACKSGCIGCGLCAKKCPENAITMVNNLPVIDYDKCIGCGICSDACPRKIIFKM